MTKSEGMRRIVLWLVAAVGVTAVASLAIAASVGASERPLSERDVAQRLADETATIGPTTSGDPTPTGTDDASSGVGAGSDIFTFAPGSVVASCDGGLVTLRNWTPNPGYRADDVVRGPATQASVWFESDTADDVELVVACDANGAVVAAANAEFDDHGGDRDDGHGGGHGGGDNSGSGRDHPEDD